MSEGEDFWEAHYASHKKDRKGAVNMRLAQFAKDLAPARALDLGCGPGVDTLWLAERAWNVTAVDISATALSRTKDKLKEAGLAKRGHVEQHDLPKTFPTGRYDLVSAQFLQSPIPLDRTRVLHAAAEAVQSGGYLLVVEHGSTSPWSWFPDATHPPPEELVSAAGLSDEHWTIECSAALERDAFGPSGERAVVLDNVLFARKHVRG